MRRIIYITKFIGTAGSAMPNAECRMPGEMREFSFGIWHSAFGIPFAIIGPSRKLVRLVE
jgi:hypothetical protein